MSMPRILLPAFSACAALFLLACGSAVADPDAGSTASSATAGNPITGEGLPNPAPNVTRNWGELPEGRTWGTSAGIDIDPNDGHVWAYERCGAGTFGAGAPMTCETNPVDPVFKFDRHTGEVLAAFGRGLFVTPHGLHVDSAGNVWVADFQGNAAGTKGHQVIKFSPSGHVIMRLGRMGGPGEGVDDLGQPGHAVAGEVAVGRVDVERVGPDVDGGLGRDLPRVAVRDLPGDVRPDRLTALERDLDAHRGLRHPRPPRGHRA